MANNTTRTALAPNQGSQIFTNMNDNLDGIEASFSSTLPFTVTASSMSMTTSQIWSAAIIVFSDPSPTIGSLITIDIPATVRGTFTVVNTCADDIQIEISGQSKTAPVIPAGGTARLRTDASNVEFDMGARAGFDRIIVLTQTEYDALTPDSNTLYFTT